MWILGFVTPPLLYPAKMGAYTELRAGFPGDLGIQDGRTNVVPWGRLNPCPSADLVAALKTPEHENTGIAAMFLEYCEKLLANFQ